MKTLIILIFTLFAVNLLGQSAITSAGQSTVGQQYSFSFALGEVSSSTLHHTSKRFFATAGVMQPDPFMLVYVEEGTNLRVQIYPNPAAEFIFLDPSLKELIHYQIINAEGISLLRGLWTGQALDISLLTPGLYHLELRTPRGRSSINTKFIKL